MKRGDGSRSFPEPHYSAYSFFTGHLWSLKSENNFWMVCDDFFLISRRHQVNTFMSFRYDQIPLTWTKIQAAPLITLFKACSHYFLFVLKHVWRGSLEELLELSYFSGAVSPTTNYFHVSSCERLLRFLFTQTPKYFCCLHTPTPRPD